MSKKQKIQNIYRMTPMQEGMLFHSLAHGQSGAYYEQRVFTISGDLEKDLLEQAFQRLVDRYDILRTIFRHQNVKEPLQVVMAQRTFKLHFEDISAMDEDQRVPTIENYAAQERQKGFDLSRDLLVRGSLFKTGRQSYSLIWSYHHILMDAWCWGILFKDLIQLYRCLKQNAPIDLKPVPSYSLYIKWLEKRNKERGLAFWKDYLDGYDSVASLPGSRQSHETGDYKLGELFFNLPAEDGEKFDLLAKETALTQSVLFQTIWGVLAQKYNDSDDAVFGAVVSGRPPEIPGVEDMVGLFINTIPVRVKRERGMTFTQLLKSMGRSSAAAREFEFVPLPLIQAQSGRKGQLMDHIMGFQNYPGLGEVQGDKPDDDLGFRLTGMKAHEQTNYNFNIMFIPGTDATIKFSYNEAVYDPLYVKQVERHLLHIIRQVVENPHIPLDEIQLVTAEERRQIVETFNSKPSDTGKEETIQQLFSRRAKLKPDRVAVSSPVDISRIWEDDHMPANTCFRAAEHVISRTISNSRGGNELVLLKTPRHHALLANRNLLELLKQLRGERRLGDILEQLRTQPVQFLYCPVKAADLLEVTYELSTSATAVSSSQLEAMASMFKALLENYFVEPVDYKEEVGTAEALDLESFDSDQEPEAFTPQTMLLDLEGESSTGGTLLLGDTPGQPSVGLFYLASYLKRNDIPAYAAAYDPSDSESSFKTHLRSLVQQVQPTVIAVSLKWFLYIERALRTCAIIRESAPDAVIVVGGNTASYYWQELIKEDCIDIIVRGDGEEPLLRIARGDDPAAIPNIVYREEGKVKENPFTYVQRKDNAGDVYLSHLDDILLGGGATQLGSFFVPTHKGCRMNCHFCGGCRGAQKQAFNRDTVLRRDAGTVRLDIKEAMPHATTFQFDFEAAGDGLLQYCREIFEGLDLTNHFCIVATLLPPDKTLMNFFSQTFKYVYFDIDITTFSARHRSALEEAGLVKPQPTDDQIIEVIKQCETLANAEVRVNLITGLPLFREDDARESEQLFARLTQSRSSFFELHWARLHAQPGAPILEKADSLDMHPYARTYEDFLDYSRQNFSQGSQDPTFETFQYPYIYYTDQDLNSQTTRFYTDINREMGQFLLEKIHSRNLNRTLSYRQLDAKSGQLAHTLKERGIGGGDIVAILTENSIETVIALLAVLKTGAAYLPIDPQYPDERVNYMIQDSDARLLLSTAALTAGKTFGCDVLDITDAGDYHQRPLADEESGVGDSGVYAIYTSGTSGRSKGVLVTHANLMNYVDWFSREAAITSEDNAMLASSYAFDLGYTALFPSLLSGAGLCLPPKEIYLDPRRLLDYMAQNRISYIKMTPSLFTTIVNHRDFSDQNLPALKFIAVGGEAIIGDDIETAHQRHRTVRMINHYGPTEATIGCVFHRIQREQVKTYVQQPVIGRAISNNIAYIMDRQRNLMPVGTAGELCVGGAGIAAGYLNRPDLTDDKFFIDPITGSQRLYATGDLARFLPDGSIEFLGRVDQQVKIRGYRVETGEVEALLRKCDGVADSVVVPVKNEKDEQFLCAYIVPSNGRVNKPAAILAPDQEGSDAVAHWIKENYDDGFRLSPEERTRYKRQILLSGWGEGKQEVLKGKTVFVAGAGGGASPTIMQLALAGVGTIRVCDFDEVELSNLNRQFLHDESRIGMNKALSAQMTVERVNPHVRVIPITEKLTRDNVFDIVGDADVIFDMFDGQDSKFILSECALAKGIPHIISAMIDINGYAAMFRPPDGPCFHCLFDKKKLESIISGIKHQKGDYEKNPLPVIATSLFMSAGFGVNEAVKYMLGLGSPALGKFMLFNQRGSADLAASDSYQAMTFTFSDHFKESSAKQGFDWSQGWRGQFLEELAVEPDPHCPCCGPNGTHLIAPATTETQSDTKASPNAVEPSEQRVAILSSNGGILSAGLTGIFKTGKVGLPLDPEGDERLLARQLADSGARLMVTDCKHLALAQKIRDRANSNIKVAAVEDIEETDKPVEAVDGAYSSDWPALLLQGTGNGDEDTVISHKDFAVAMRDGDLEKGHPRLIRLKTILEGGAEAPDDDALRTYLNRHLPTYMVPGHFVAIEEIPLTPNGKLDRLRLPDPMAGDTAQEYVAPRNDVESAIATIGAEVLGLEKIGINDNFFEYGLDSIKAIQISSRLLTRKYKLEINDILAEPTVASLAQKAGGAENTIRSRAVKPVEKRDYYPLSSAQKRLYIVQYLKSNNTSFNLPMTMVLEGDLDRERLEQAFKELIDRHESLRTAFQMKDSDPVQRVFSHIDFSLEYTDISNRSAEDTGEGLDTSEIERKLVEDFVRPFDLSIPGQLRVGLIRTGERSHILMVDTHHIVTDGMSMNILTGEFSALYNGGQLKPLKLQYKDYSQWLHREREHGALKDQENYWLRQFSDGVPEFELPTDFPRPEQLNFEGETLIFQLEKNVAADLKQMCRRGNVTLQMYFTAVLAVLLFKYTGTEDFALGTGVAGRRHADLEFIIGMFINMLALRVKPNPELSFEGFLADVKQTSIDAFANQDFQFEELVKKLNLQRDLARNPIFDAVFQMQNLDTFGDAIGDFSIKPYKTKKRSSHFDLVIYGVERDETVNLILVYSTDLFKAETAQRMAADYSGIVRQTTANPRILLENIETEQRKAEADAADFLEDTGDFVF
jgi:amino acid adenylation domain-containing protein